LGKKARLINLTNNANTRFMDELNFSIPSGLSIQTRELPKLKSMTTLNNNQRMTLNIV
jgi:hypothetical protein